MISRYTYRDLVWVDVEKPTHEGIRTLMEEYDIHPIVADELLSPSMRPRVESYENFIYAILHFPALRHSHTSPNQEVDFVIGKKFLVTVHYDLVDPLHKFSKVFEVNSILDRSDIGEHAGFLLFYMLRKLYASLLHEIAIIGEDLKGVENEIFGGKERAMVERLSMVNRDLLAFHRALRMHEPILHSLSVSCESFFGAEFQHYIENILGEFHKVNEHLVDQKEILADLRDTNTSLLSTKTNEVIKILTAITFITFPASFLSWVFAVDAEHKPITGVPYDFWIIAGIMVLSSLLTWGLLKAKRWI